MKYYSLLISLLFLLACQNEKKHFDENGQITSLYKGKQLVEEYSYHKDKPDVLAKSTVYHQDSSFVTSYYNKQGIKTRVDSHAVSGSIEKRYYNHSDPEKVSRREFYGADSLYMANYDTLGSETAVVINSKRFSKRLYRGTLISHHDKAFVNGLREKWDYHPNGVLNKYELFLQDERVEYFEFHNPQGEMINKRISVNGYHSMYTDALYEISKDSLLHFFAYKKETDANTARLKTAYEKQNTETEKAAQYPGGKKALQKYLSSHINYGEKTTIPQKCKELHLLLLIDKSGKAHIAENPDCLFYDILSSSYKAAAQMPKWKAVQSNGEAVVSLQKITLKL